MRLHGNKLQNATHISCMVLLRQQHTQIRIRGCCTQKRLNTRELLPRKTFILVDEAFSDRITA